MRQGFHVGGQLRRAAVVTLSLLVLVAAAATASAGQDRIVIASILSSDPKMTTALDFELEDLSGTSVRLSQYRGERPVLIYFWATWCPYCVSAKPKIAKMRETITPDQLEILAVNVGGGDSLARLKKYQEKNPVSWPVLYDTVGKVTRDYHVQGIPLFVLVDKEGNVVYRDNSLPTDPMKYLNNKKQ